MKSNDINIDITEAKIYVGTYAKYNSGSIEGAWLTLSDYLDKDEFLDACKKLHVDECECPVCGGRALLALGEETYKCQNSGCGWKGDWEEVVCQAEFMFQDWKNIPSALIGESWVSENVWELQEIMDEISDAEAFWVFVNYMSYDMDKTDGTDMKNDFEDSYQGSYSSEEEFAECIADDIYDIPENLRSYIDYSAIARDFFMGDYFYDSGYVFRCI